MNITSNSRPEYPDEAGYTDGAGFLSEDQTAPQNETPTDPDKLRADIPFDLIRDIARMQYVAVTGDQELGTIAFELFGSRIALVHTQVEPEYRHQRIASELIWRVLDDVRSRGENVTATCPLVRTFINRHADYSDLIDSAHPGP
jgi:predicted GNAT family acetyltransferase